MCRRLWTKNSPQNVKKLFLYGIFVTGNIYSIKEQMKPYLSCAIFVERHFSQEAVYGNTVCYREVFPLHLAVKEYKIPTRDIGNFPKK